MGFINTTLDSTVGLGFAARFCRGDNSATLAGVIGQRGRSMAAYAPNPGSNYVKKLGLVQLRCALGK